jgi:hypothetical protein
MRAQKGLACLTIFSSAVILMFKHFKVSDLPHPKESAPIIFEKPMFEKDIFAKVLSFLKGAITQRAGRTLSVKHRAGMRLDVEPPI